MVTQIVFNYVFKRILRGERFFVSEKTARNVYFNRLNDKKIGIFFEKDSELKTVKEQEQHLVCSKQTNPMILFFPLLKKKIRFCGILFLEDLYVTASTIEDIKATHGLTSPNATIKKKIEKFADKYSLSTKNIYG